MQPGDNYVKAIGYKGDYIELFKVTGEYQACNVCGEQPLSKNWQYTLNESDKTITLRRYIGADADVIVNNTYRVNGVTYKTKLASNIDNQYGWGNTNYMFYGNKTVTSIMFEDDIDTSETYSMSGMFCNCPSLISIDLRNFDTSNVINMSNMFRSCTSLTNLDLDNFDTSNVTNMAMMFNYCPALTFLNVRNFDTSNVTNMSAMFYKTALTSLDLSSFNTNNVTDMEGIFYDCSSLKTIYVTQNKWSTSQADTTNMFYNCGTSSVTYK